MRIMMVTGVRLNVQPGDLEAREVYAHVTKTNPRSDSALLLWDASWIQALVMLLLRFCTELSSRPVPLAVCALGLIILSMCLTASFYTYRSGTGTDRFTGQYLQSVGLVWQTNSNPQNSMAAFQMAPIGLGSKVVHYIGIRVPFGTQLITKQQGEEDETSLWVAFQTNQLTRHQLKLCGWWSIQQFFGAIMLLSCAANNSVLY